MAIDWTKPIQTKDGKPARFLAKLNTDQALNHVIAITHKEDVDYECVAVVNGASGAPWGIVNVPPPDVVLAAINVYPASWKGMNLSNVEPHIDVDTANRAADNSRLALVKISLVNGKVKVEVIKP